MKTLVLLGAGGFARTISDIVRQTGQFDEIVLLDDAMKDGVAGRCSQYVDHIGAETEFFPAISDNRCRRSWIDTLHGKGVKVATIIHPSAYVSPTVKMEDGIAVLPGAIVNTGARLASGVLVNCGAVIDHDSVIECCSHIKPRAVVRALSVVEAESVIE